MCISDFIKIKKLCKNYSNKTILSNINLNIKKGSIYGLVGENGAGKTTLIRLLLGFANPTSGEITYNSKYNCKIGSIVEAPAFYSYLSAKENLEYYRIQKNIKDDNIVEETLDKVGLLSSKNEKFSKFSLGMKQRLAIGLALLDNPGLLILDEPINGLDPKGIKDVRDLLISINKEFGTTIIVSSHLLSELSQLATDYIFINKGKIIKEFKADELASYCENYLEIITDNAPKAKDILLSNFKNLNIEIIHNKLKIYDSNVDSYIVNKTLMDNSIKVFEIYRNNITLEDYFLNLIGGNTNA